METNTILLISILAVAGVFTFGRFLVRMISFFVIVERRHSVAEPEEESESVSPEPEPEPSPAELAAARLADIESEGLADLNREADEAEASVVYARLRLAATDRRERAVQRRKEAEEEIKGVEAQIREATESTQGAADSSSS